jgi:hypothetical protein
MSKLDLDLQDSAQSCHCPAAADTVPVCAAAFTEHVYNVGLQLAPCPKRRLLQHTCYAAGRA